MGCAIAVCSWSETSSNPTLKTSRARTGAVLHGRDSKEYPEIVAENLPGNTLSFYTYSDICRSERAHPMNPTKSDVPQGTLDLLILKVATLGPIHGYAIAQRLQQISRDALQVQQGSLYPALHPLENKGFLAAEGKASETGREAKFYSLTSKGRRLRRDDAGNWLLLPDA